MTWKHMSMANDVWLKVCIFIMTFPLSIIDYSRHLSCVVHYGCRSVVHKVGTLYIYIDHIKIYYTEYASLFHMLMLPIYFAHMTVYCVWVVMSVSLIRSIVNSNNEPKTSHITLKSLKTVGFNSDISRIHVPKYD